jgi:hypothetical protein
MNMFPARRMVGMDERKDLPRFTGREGLPRFTGPEIWTFCSAAAGRPPAAIFFCLPLPSFTFRSLRRGGGPHGGEGGLNAKGERRIRRRQGYGGQEEAEGRAEWLWWTGCRVDGAWMGENRARLNAKGERRTLRRQGFRRRSMSHGGQVGGREGAG